MQKRYALASFLAVVIVLTAVVSCIGHERRADADLAAMVESY